MKKVSFKSLVDIRGDAVFTTSLKIAEKFGKQHKDVLKSIRNVECSEEFAQRNFAPGSYTDAQNQERPMFEVSRDGFTFLAMGSSVPTQVHTTLIVDGDPLTNSVDYTGIATANYYSGIHNGIQQTLNYGLHYVEVQAVIGAQTVTLQSGILVVST